MVMNRPVVCTVCQPFRRQETKKYKKKKLKMKNRASRSGISRYLPSLDSAQQQTSPNTIAPNST